MFFKKNKNQEESVPKKGIKKMDAIVTGAILGTVVASLYGVKKLKDKSEDSSENQEKNEENSTKNKKTFFEKIFRKK